MKIGVFDSGIGGERIAKLLQLEYPSAEIINVSDRENLPYGNKNLSQLSKLVIPRVKNMELEGCDIIVIACNTVTTNLISEIRESVSVPVVGFEPMVKPAAKLTRSKNITVFATPLTLNSSRYKYLKKSYANDIRVHEPDVSNWAYLIENNKINTQHIKNIVKEAKQNNSDVIVLGCTHYHWIEKIISQEAGDRIIVLQPEDPILRRTKMIVSDINSNL